MSKTKARTFYESMIGGVMSTAWRREGESIQCDPADSNTPLVALFESEDEERGASLDYLPPDLAELRFMARPKLAALVEKLAEEIQLGRKNTLNTFLDYLFGEGPDILTVLQRLFIYTRAARRENVWNMKGVEMAALFGHSKQNWQTMEERIIEELVERWSRSSFTSSGGKSYAARVAYSNQRKGNHARLTGVHADDDLPPLPPDDGELKLDKRAKVRAEMMRRQAEREYVADLCDCAPDEIDLSKISFSQDF